MTKALMLAASMALLTSAAAVAGEATLTSGVFKEVETRDAGGRASVSLQPAARITPGDQVVYVVTYHNGGASPAENVVIDNPLAADLAYAGPADARPPLVSVDGQTFGPLQTLTKTRDGVRSAAVPADVTAVRWRIDEAVPAGGAVRLSFRARLK